MPAQCRNVFLRASTIKLTTDFKATIDLGSELGVASGDITALTRLMALDDGRALCFGWYVRSNQPPEAHHEEYWAAEVSRSGVVVRALPALAEPATPGRPQYLPSFAFGSGFGVLVSSQAALLFSSLQAQPQPIAVENHFAGLGVLAHPTHKSESHYEPVLCGTSHGDCVPVVFSSPTRKREGRYLALLQIDAAQGRARWLHTAVDGSPRTTRLDEYAPLSRGELGPGGLRLNEQNKFVKDLSPVVSDCAWAGTHWLLYAAGFNSNLMRFGIPLGVLTRNAVDLTLFDVVLRPEEPSYGKICSSGDRLVATPLRANGPRKGKQSMFLFEDKQEQGITPPRGHAGWQVLDHAGRHTWMAPMAMGYNRAPFELIACRAA